MNPARHSRHVDSHPTPAPSLVPQWVDFLEHLPFSASVTDEENRFVAINTAHTRTYGWQSDRIVGQTPRLLTSGDVSEAFLRELNTATLRGGWHGRVLNHTQCGRRLEVMLHTSPVRNTSGQVLLLGVACQPGQEGDMLCCLLELAWHGSLLAAPGAAKHSLRVKALTPREHATFRLLGQGLRTAEIAFHLGISFNTARVFIAAVRVKLGCASLEALRALAARRPH